MHSSKVHTNEVRSNEVHFDEVHWKAVTNRLAMLMAGLIPQSFIDDLLDREAVVLPAVLPAVLLLQRLLCTLNL